MLSLKQKFLVVGVTCVIPTYVIGGCIGQLNNGQLNATCQGKTEQLQISSISYELLKKNSALRNSVLDNADSLEELRTNVSSILTQVTISTQRTLQELKSIEQSIRTNTRLLNNQNHSREERQRLRSSISRLKKEKFDISERNSQQLYQLYQTHKKETSSLESQLRSNIHSKYQVKQKLSIANNKNKHLESFIYSAADTFSGSLASSFTSYSECIKKSDFLSTYTFSEIHNNRNESSSNNSFSSTNISSISTLPGLSSSGISSSSLGSCANEFRSLRKRFTLYEVALNLFMSSDVRKRGVVADFFKVYKGITPSQNTITRFIQAFNRFPKNGLLGLIRNIDAEMQNY
ncbi:MAG: Unknown protein [uncultured Sulfurovum sp.]|uniref:Uncharacterized protein n=1 Tax=uncultured Sulfurovum sp. TaxID=269237 RepID=A0A6S6RXI0_9BACT|nr:MAG: Unknown protein [uncultured Sulfurovum sp.]